MDSDPKSGSAFSIPPPCPLGSAISGVGWTFTWWFFRGCAFVLVKLESDSRFWTRLGLDGKIPDWMLQISRFGFRDRGMASRRDYMSVCCERKTLH
ncbi:uncharacterized protein BO95DRAFT_446640 [Aspergillus brunneoviolaceus CBS 621.78]|uniref:Uncharacterized protein n=1 Tax=Aspergillus brunneoviolaceus CBS 621.78 TaxID=1450534 RepID=A0ACD1FXP9_9EURO|nr:hypothetical protein BO95DRAFT_446640 [Aspergillus brunneoviolaceus CBS 621.78]RAH41786.1 hypothetical protein BO95DRAFT_446640 [Aspergillus brunneoviolaceus CBS 621.78]